MTDTDYREKARAVVESINRFRATVVGGYDYKDMEGPVDAIAAVLKEVAEEAVKCAGSSRTAELLLKEQTLRHEAEAKLAALTDPVDDEEVRAALAWMDRRDKEYDYSRGGEKHGQILASALRSTTAKLKEAEARIRTLEKIQASCGQWDETKKCHEAEIAEEKLKITEEALGAAEKSEDEQVARASKAEKKAAALEKSEIDRCHGLALAWDYAKDAFARES